VLNGKSVRGIGVVVLLLLAINSFALAQSTDDQGASRCSQGRTGSLGRQSRRRLHCAEWKSYLDRMFTLADRNHDGRLDAKEFETVRKAAPMLADADFGYFDENQDGKVTRSEFVTKPSEFILSNDKNGDCRVTPDEMKAAGRPGRSAEARSVSLSKRFAIGRHLPQAIPAQAILARDRLSAVLRFPPRTSTPPVGLQVNSVPQREQASRRAGGFSNRFVMMRTEPSPSFRICEEAHSGMTLSD